MPPEFTFQQVKNSPCMHSCTNAQCTAGLGSDLAPVGRTCSCVFLLSPMQRRSAARGRRIRLPVRSRLCPHVTIANTGKFTTMSAIRRLSLYTVHRGYCIMYNADGVGQDSRTPVGRRNGWLDGWMDVRPAFLPSGRCTQRCVQGDVFHSNAWQCIPRTENQWVAD